MSPAISITLLLLCASVVTSLEVQPEEDEDFPPQLNHDVRRRTDNHTEEILQDGAFPGSCRACKSIVSIVKKKLGSDHSKEKIGRLLNNACNRVKIRLVRSACKTVVRKLKTKLIDAIANSWSAGRTCAELKLCKSNKTVYR